MKILVIDNYDSFTYNLCHLVARVAGEFPDVRRSDEIDLAGVRAMTPDAVILSPGPGHPARERDFGVSQEGRREVLGFDAPVAITTGMDSTRSFTRTFSCSASTQTQCDSPRGGSRNWRTLSSSAAHS